MNETVVTYEPDNSIKKGYLSLLREISAELQTNQWLIYQLFKRDFLAMYKQSFLGIFWAVIVPLVSVGTFTVLNRSGVFSLGAIDIPYPLYALLGLMFWQVFATGVLSCSNALINAGPMIVKINFSKKSLVFASSGQALVGFVIQWCVVTLLFFYYHVTPDVIILFLPILLIPLFLFTLGLGFLLSLINGVMRDVGNVLSTLITFLLFLTPVLYSKPATGFFAQATRYNILYYLVTVPRDLVLQGTSSELYGYFFSVFLACGSFVFCLITFHLTETRVTERI